MTERKLFSNLEIDGRALHLLCKPQASGDSHSPRDGPDPRIFNSRTQPKGPGRCDHEIRWIF
jgi:hypothetical protein